MSDEEPSAKRGAHRFSTTRWSLVLAAARDDADDARPALEELCTRYWHPLYAYARRRGHDPDEARDLTQAFFAKLLEKRDLDAADPARGRFRTFLLAAMKNFLAAEWRRDHAQKRGGAVEILPLDFDSAEQTYGLESLRELSPEAIYHRRWALGLLERAVRDLRERYVKNGNVELFDALKAYVGGDESALPYAELASRLGQSEGALRTAASRLRARWRLRVHELIAETVQTESDVPDELRRLIAAVQPPA